MASPTAGIALAERTDIHKSCKSVETLLNILNEYCEAAGAVVALQKKLAKALRDTAGQKITGEISANAMNTSANIYEALSDIDSRFARIADKEYDIISAEVKKWFKKLAKEEKGHDERISNANAKIKQAGQTYEKKSKRKAADAGEEHARYINIISTLGPEVSQEKFNHALNVTQKHNGITYSVAACLSRLADTEWQKSCECIRRLSPTIGPLGQWRSLCEGGWTGPIPADLPDLNASSEVSGLQPDSIEAADVKLIEEETRQPPTAAWNVMPTPEPREQLEQPRIPPPGYSTGPPSASASSNDLLKDQVVSHNLASLAKQQQPGPTTTFKSNTLKPLEPPRPPFVDAATGSVRSLSAFPAPPNHFPLPPPRSQNSSHFQSGPSASLDFPSHTQFAESPISGNEDNTLEESFSKAKERGSRNSTLSPPSPEIAYRERPRIAEEQNREQYDDTDKSDIKRPISVRPQTSLPSDSTYESNREQPTLRRKVRHVPSSSADFKSKNSHLQMRESFDRESQELEDGNRTEETKLRTNANTKHSRLERMDTAESTGNIVAAMRNRYSSNPGSASPPPRDLPRLPLSVNDLASRYQPTDAPLSPRMKAGSPPVLRQHSLPLIDTTTLQSKDSYQDRNSGKGGSKQGQDNRRQRRYDDIAEVDRKAKEQALRERERELEIRAQELERDRARLQTLLEDDTNANPNIYHEGSSGQSQTSQFGLRPRERRTSLKQQLQRPLSQMELEDINQLTPRASSGTTGNNSNRQYPDNGKHLILPSNVDVPFSSTRPLRSPKGAHHTPQYRDAYPNNSGGSTSNVSSVESTTAHAPYCGCETCSVSKYKDSGSSSAKKQQSSDHKFQQGQWAEKPTKGSWIRRLSMPVGNAFSLDSKRHQNNNSTSNMYGLGSGVGNIPASPSRGLFFMKNASTTALLSSSTNSGESGLVVQEDGRLRQGRRSLEISGASNRSMTNLGLPTGR